jgi:hypothetical protein
VYINNGDGTFTEKAKQYLKHTSRFAMGCDIADFNNDLLPDIYVVDMLPDDNKRQKLMSIGITNNVFNYSLQQGYLPSMPEIPYNCIMECFLMASFRFPKLASWQVL